MDSFHEPYTRAGDDISLDAVREQVRALEDSHKAHGVQLSGRIVHVCHYLPVVPTLISHLSPAAAGVLSPPPSPPTLYGDVPESPTADDTEVQQSQQPSVPSRRWKFAPRYGHAAMISGIRALSATHDQAIVGWTGDILSLPSAGAASAEENGESTGNEEESIPSHLVSQADREALEAELVGYDEDGQGQGIEGNKGKLEYVPVWLEDEVAHGHYEGYCKTSACSLSLISSLSRHDLIVVLCLALVRFFGARFPYMRDMCHFLCGNDGFRLLPDNHAGIVAIELMGVPAMFDRLIPYLGALVKMALVTFPTRRTAYMRVGFVPQTWLKIDVILGFFFPVRAAPVISFSPHVTS